MAYNMYNQPSINQLLRYKDNIDNMINQMSTPPVQNIINTGTDFEARILKDNEQVDNILINRRTMFLDKLNKKLIIKELDGTISEEYEIVIPLDDKDKKIIDLESKLKEMENKLDEYTKPIRTNDDIKQSHANDDEFNQSTTKAGYRQF